MLYYGYAFNIDKTGLVDYEFDDECIHTGYSVKAYDPEMAIYGISLGGNDDLFCPTRLEDYIAIANEYGKAAASDFNELFSRLPESVQKKIAGDKKPEFLLCVMDDD